MNDKKQNKTLTDMTTYKVWINCHDYSFKTKEEAESFARFWNVELPK